MNILTTGNPTKNLAKSINEKIGGDFVSKSMGYDLCDDKVKDSVVEMSLKYDVFINSAVMHKFHQTLLLSKLWNFWYDNSKKGHIVNIGSTADAGVKGTPKLYNIEKKALRDFNKNLSNMTIGGSNIKMTYISPGYIKTPKIDEKHPEKYKLEPNYIADVIKWVIEQPNYVNISEIRLDPIQE